MFINIFNINHYYRGVQRLNNVFDYGYKIFDKYSDLMENEYICFSKNNAVELLKIAGYINKNPNNCEVIAFGEDHDFKLKKDSDINFNFQGYDVSGESKYLSPLETILSPYSDETHFKTIRDIFLDKINKNGLFISEKSAMEFAKYVEDSNSDSFEKDGELKVLKIFKISEHVNLKN